MASSTSTPQLSTATSSPPATGLVSPADDELAGKTPATAAEVNEDVDEDEPEAKTFDPDFVAQETTEAAKKSRLTRLNYLLEQSSIYTKILQDKMEKQRLDRIKAEARQAAKKEKLAAEGELDAQFMPVAERRSGRTAAEEATITERKKGDAKGKAKDVGKRKVEKLEMENALEEAVGSTSNKKDKKVKQEAEPSAAPAAASEHGTQPALVTGAVMRDYQLAGLQWLISLYENGLNGILADEMGLGKTLQTISFFAHLRSKGVWGPFLVVGPMSVLQNWQNEFAKFTPDIPTVQYYGNPEERKNIRMTSLSPPTDATGANYAGKMPGGGGKPLSKMTKRERAKAKEPLNFKPNSMATFPIVLTTFDMAIKDSKYLRGFLWKYIVVDEGHRLKNMDCLLIRELKTFSSANRLILTGTPLHNNLSELWSLLNFILPDIFDDLESFQQWFDLDSDIRKPSNASAPGEKLISDEGSRGIVTKLHSILKPFLLRRLKVDVEKNLPPKKEYLLHAPLTTAQKDLYEQVVARTLRAFLIKKKAGEIGSADNDDTAVHSDDEESAIEQSLVADEEKPVERHEDGRVKRAQRQGVVRKDYTTDLMDNDDKWFKKIEVEREEEEERSMATTAEEALEAGRAYEKRLATKSVNNMRLLNVVMQLRKVASHPFLFDWPIDHRTGQAIINKDLVEASGKMLLLNRLLDALFEKKHKVLLFSQFTTMLNIIEDWAIEYKGIKVYRIDGTTKQADRQAQMNAFNAEGEEDGVCRLFILSTRAGGLGINLVAADTVIFYDQDWNPQMDLQAQDRAHRIGQKRPVLVFRLVTAHTVEEKILKKAGAKRRLEAMVIADGKFKGGAAPDKRVSAIDEATALLKLEGDKIDLVDAGDKIISDEDLEMLLDRSPEAFGRTKGWHSSQAVSATNRPSKAKGEKTAFEVWEAAKDVVNDGLAAMEEEE